MQLIINPGSGPVIAATEENAISNIEHFILDSGIKDVDFVRIPSKDYGDGRFAFVLWKDNICHEVQMPGLSLEKVRYVDSEEQDIWQFPRLYVDGSSWVWKFAINLSFTREDEN